MVKAGSYQWQYGANVGSVGISVQDLIRFG
jgi:hypothetical protein